MNVLISGATGFVGSEVAKHLHQQGHGVFVISRDQEKAKQRLPFAKKVIACDLNQTALKSSDFANVDAVIHLAGESIDGRWTKEKKTKILESRVQSSAHLLQNMPASVKTLITASAQGYYGSRGDDVLTEESGKGQGFLADVCEEWEKPFRQKMSEADSRVCILRFGIILSHQGGVLKKILPLFKKHLGAPLGSGTQWMSWIHLQDVVGVIEQSLINSEYRGIMNVATPTPVRNSEFTEIVCKKLDVIKLPSVPEFVLKMSLGEMSHLVLDSTRLEPRRLKDLRYNYLFPKLDLALENEVKVT